MLRKCVSAVTCYRVTFFSPRCPGSRLESTSLAPNTSCRNTNIEVHVDSNHTPLTMIHDRSLAVACIRLQRWKPGPQAPVLSAAVTGSPVNQSSGQAQEGWSFQSAAVSSAEAMFVKMQRPESKDARPTVGLSGGGELALSKRGTSTHPTHPRLTKPPQIVRLCLLYHLTLVIVTAYVFGGSACRTVW